MKIYLDGEEVEVLRKERGLTKQYLSRSLGYPKGWKSFWNLCSGKSAIIEKRIVLLEEALGVDRSKFLKKNNENR